MRVALTGANGFLGRELAHHLVAGGESPILLARRPPRDPSLARCAYIPYSLEDGLGGKLPDDCGSIVHCAFQMGAGGAEGLALNIRAAADLRDLARADGRARHFVFVSSMAAQADAQSDYGRAKWAIEQALDETAECVVRPGLIVGPGGLFGRIKHVIDKYHVVPIFDGGRQLFQTIWVHDLARALAGICRDRTVGKYSIGSVRPVTFKELCAKIAKASGRNVRFVPCPVRASLLLLRACEGAGLRLPVSSENLAGLLLGRAFDTQADLARLGLSLSDLDDALGRMAAAPESAGW